MVSKKRGSVLVYVAVGMSLMATLGLGIFYLNTTSTFSQLGASNLDKAHYLAESGVRYALKLFRGRELQNTAYTDYSLSSVSGKFNLNVSGVGSGGTITIISTGISNPGSPYEARKAISVTVPADVTTALAKAPFSFAGEGGAGTASLSTPAEGISGKSGVTVDTVNRQIILGGGATGTAGCVWYQGWADSNGSDCQAGRCNFNKGIRAYFDFQYTFPWNADGFTFAIISAHNSGTEGSPVYINNVTDCGGGACGEYMAYAGPGITGNGLKPPKIAIEFDPYVPAGDSGTICGCNSRYDSSFSSLSQHVSLMYWGDETSACSHPTRNPYDDNRHGAGSGSNPRNPLGTDSGDYKGFQTISFGASPNHYSFRVEIDRVDDSLSADYRKYKMRAWLKAYQVSGYQDSSGVSMDDTSKKYGANPTFQQTITLSQDWHNEFDRILFGWTQATGGLTQTVAILNFKIDFKNNNDF